MVGRSIASVTRSSSWPSTRYSTEPPTDQPTWYIDLLSAARKGDFNPDRYEYTTYDTIFSRTHEYCVSEMDGENIVARINDCAALLLRYARARQELHPERWRCFVSHPKRGHARFLKSEWRGLANGC